MAITKIVLDRQSDLILTSPSIATPTGILASDIKNGTGPTAPTVQNELSTLTSADASLDLKVSTETSRAEAAEESLENYIDAEVSTEASSRASADSSLEAYIDAEISTEASSRTSADTSLAAAISAINVADFGRTFTTGTIDGTNKDFNLDDNIQTGTEFVYLNGQLLTVADDYTVSGTTPGIIGIIKFVNAPQLGIRPYMWVDTLAMARAIEGLEQGIS